MVSREEWIEYLSNWSYTSDYPHYDRVPPEDPEPDAVIFAEYSYEDYSGEAFFVYIKDGIVFEGYGSHCSCYGLEGQFSPEEVGTIGFAIEYYQKKDLAAGEFRYGMAENSFKYVIEQLLKIKDEI